LMACSNTNVLVNEGFRQGLAPWTGTNIKVVPNPVYNGDSSVLLTTGSVLKQKRPLQVEKGCAYYLYFRVLNASPASARANFFATVSYLDNNGKILRSTPLLVLLPRATALKFKSYFSIVPPPPKKTRYVSVVFSGVKGRIFVDYIRLASHVV
jgi:hypothetical protein